MYPIGGLIKGSDGEIDFIGVVWGRRGKEMGGEMGNGVVINL